MVMRKFELNPDYLREGQGKADDRDLGTPQHDELMIRLLNKEVWKRLITEFGLLERSFSKSTLDYFKEKGEGLEITEIGAEVPVLRRFGGDQIIGYIDLAVKFGFEYSIEIIGCEIKATEPSFGSVVRQINKYRQYTDVSTWVVVSPYETWKVPLESQDIAWIPAKGVLRL